jgi:hypothetical protein
MDPLVTIQNLIALACGSHSEEESRTSALAACKAIARHGIVLSLPTEPEDPFSRVTSPPKPPTAKASKPRSHPSDKRPQSRANRGGDGPVYMAARFPAFCKKCGVECKVGEAVYWLRDVGVTCEHCGPVPLNKLKPNAFPARKSWNP